MCPNTYLQMNANDTVIYVHGNSSTQAASKLTQSLSHVAAWLKQCCLQLNVTKTVCMFFSKSKTHTIPPDVYISGEKLQVVTEYKYLGIMIDSRLSFKSQVKRVCDRVKFSLSNFRSIRCQLSPEAAKMYMHSMILSQMMYCFTT